MVLIVLVTNPRVHMLDLIQITSERVFTRFFSPDLSALITILLIHIFLASLKRSGRLYMVHKRPEFSWPSKENGLE